MRLAVLPLALALIAQPAVAQTRPNWNRGAPIAISVDNDRFTPDRITLRAGRPYTITIRNRSDRKHNFSAKSFFALARVAPQDAGGLTDNKVDLRPGESKRLRIIAPTTPGAEYEYRSTNLLDAAERLKGRIHVR